MALRVDYFNSCPRLQRMPTMYDNILHVSIRHVDLIPQHDTLFITNMPSGWIRSGGPLKISPDTPEREQWKIKASNLIRILLNEFEPAASVIRPWACITTDQETATGLSEALTSIGVAAPLNTVTICAGPANSTATHIWAKNYRNMVAAANLTKVITVIEEKPRVLLVALDTAPGFDAMYAKPITALAARARIQRASIPDPVIRLLTQDPPHAILVTGAGIAQPRHSTVLQHLKIYVHNGGIVVFACDFSSSISPPKTDDLWQSFGLPWEYGRYHRTLVHARCSMGSPTQIPQSYSPKAVFLKNVGANSTLWAYQALPGTPKWRSLLIPCLVQGSQCAAVWHSAGNGFIGYLGDVKAEADSIPVIVKMCGLGRTWDDGGWSI